MSYTKILGRGRYDRSKKLIIFKGKHCDNCDCENKDETTVLAFDNSDNEYSCVMLCKNCIIKFIEIDFKHNKKCHYCEDYFEELITKHITHDTPGGIKIQKFEFCKECDKLHGEKESDVQNVSYAEMAKRKLN